MTERWRKRLGDLDKQSPSENLFERAKGGPQLPDEPISRPSTRTRVVTGVAAFAVFALAISIFAIPAVRLKGESSALDAASVQLPLWPVRTMDAVRLLQAKEDDTPSLLGDPSRVAQAFGANVLGWKNFRIDEIPSALAPNAVSLIPTCYQQAADLCGASSAAAYEPIGPSGSSPTAPSGYRAFQLTTTACSGDACIGWREFVVVFQPDRQGPDGLWMVLRAEADGISLAFQPGEALEDGAPIDAMTSITGADAILGYQAGEGACSASDATTMFERTSTPGPGTTSAGDAADLIYGDASAELGIVLPDGPGCTGPQPGYLYAASFEVGAAGVIGDPIVEGGAIVTQLTAVPVTFEWPEPGTTTSSPPANADVSWTTFSDPLGWTINVPSSWVTVPIDGSDGHLTYAGAAFGSARPQQYPGGPTTLGAAPGEVTIILYHAEGGPAPAPVDDSAFPLSFGELKPEEGGRTLNFRAGGLGFTISIRFADAPTSEQQTILETMVSSISFEPWSTGDTRNGWTALGHVLPSATAQWVTFRNDHWYASDVKGDRLFIGPVPTCVSGGSYQVRETGVVGLECLDGTAGDWDFKGHPQQSNSPRFAVALDGYTAILGWDGNLLAQLPQASG